MYLEFVGEIGGGGGWRGEGGRIQFLAYNCKRGRAEREMIY